MRKARPEGLAFIFSAGKLVSLFRQTVNDFGRRRFSALTLLPSFSFLSFLVEATG
ncbi:MAG: hypothetical protein HYU35_01680 [Parcubacteria group bacterium]|nr:hypothetical protein [Parcubacteria group bacterium]